MSAHTEALIDAAIDAQLDAILRASGSALRHYSMPKTISDMRAALRFAVAALSLPDPSAAPVVPPGFSLVAVKGFDELLYWLDRCESKGHLENCSDLIEPWANFEWQRVDAAPPAPQQGEQAGQEGVQG